MDTSETLGRAKVMKMMMTNYIWKWKQEVECIAAGCRKLKKANLFQGWARAEEQSEVEKLRQG